MFPFRRSGYHLCCMMVFSTRLFTVSYSHRIVQWACILMHHSVVLNPSVAGHWGWVFLWCSAERGHLWSLCCPYPSFQPWAETMETNSKSWTFLGYWSWFKFRFDFFLTFPFVLFLFLITFIVSPFLFMLPLHCWNY